MLSAAAVISPPRHENSYNPLILNKFIDWHGPCIVIAGYV